MGAQNGSLEFWHFGRILLNIYTIENVCLCRSERSLPLLCRLFTMRKQYSNKNPFIFCKMMAIPMGKISCPVVYFNGWACIHNIHANMMALIDVLRFTLHEYNIDIYVYRILTAIVDKLLLEFPSLINCWYHDIYIGLFPWKHEWGWFVVYIHFKNTWTSQAI